MRMLLGFLILFQACGSNETNQEHTAPAEQTTTGAESEVDVVVAPAGPAAGSGSPIAGTEEERVVSEMVATAARSESAERFFAEMIYVGAALWQAIPPDDPILQLGTNLELVVATAEGQLRLPGRMFRGEDIATFVNSEAFRALVRPLADEVARPANQDERNVYYRLIPWEIAGQPVTVVGTDRNRMLVDIADGDEIMWVDLVAPYIREEQ